MQLTQLVVIQNNSKLSVVALLPTSHPAPTFRAIPAAVQQETIGNRHITGTALPIIVALIVLRRQRLFPDSSRLAVTSHTELA
ncbi:MAG: hypothetical protein IIB04_06060 [Acidobacteria bacterium]|nr:hypothetical protein [Acidobacteriota bacterium]